MTVPEILKEARTRCGYTMREVGSMIDRSHQVVYFAEKGVSGIAIDGVLLRQLCDAYSIDFEPVYEQLKCEKGVK